MNFMIVFQNITIFQYLYASFLSYGQDPISSNHSFLNSFQKLQRAQLAQQQQQQLQQRRSQTVVTNSALLAAQQQQAALLLQQVPFGDRVKITIKYISLLI